MALLGAIAVGILVYIGMYNPITKRNLSRKEKQNKQIRYQEDVSAKESQQRARKLQHKVMQEQELKQLKHAKLAQQIQQRGRELGMLITTIENINKPFEIKGTVFIVADPMDQNAFTGAAQDMGMISLSDIKEILVKRLTKETHKKGGNALIGLRLFQANQARDIFAYGTAVKIN